MPSARWIKPTLADIMRYAPMARTHPMYDGCVAHWVLAEDDGIVAHNVLHPMQSGTLQGGTIWKSGEYGTVATFPDSSGTITDNDNVIAIGNVPDFRLQNLTIRVVATRASLGVFHALFALQANSAAGQNAGILIRFQNTNAIACLASISDTFESVVSTETFIANRRYDCVVVKDGTSVTIYVDGRVVASGSFSSETIDYTSTTPRTSIGAYFNSVNYVVGFRGDIEQVLVFNRPLTPHEIIAQYHNPWAPYQRKRIWIARPQAVGGAQTVVAPPAQVVAKATTPRLAHAIVPAPAKSIAQTSFPSLTTPYPVPPAQAKYAASTPRLTLGAVPIPAKAIATATVPTLTQAMSGRPAQAVWQASVPRATTAQMLQPAPAQAVWTATRSRLTQAIVPQPAKAIIQTSVPRLTQAIVPQPAKAIAQTSTPTLTHTIKGATARAIWQLGTPVVTGGGLAPVQAPPAQVVAKATVPTLTQAMAERPAQGVWQTSRPIPGSNITVPPAKAIAQTSVPRLTQAIVPRPAQAKYLLPAPVMTLTMRPSPARAIAQTPRPVLALAMQPRPAQAQWSLVVPVLARTAIVLPAQGVWRVTVPTTNDGSSAQTVTAAPALAKWALTTPIVTRPDAPYTRLAPAILLTITQTASAVVLDYA